MSAADDQLAHVGIFRHTFKGGTVSKVYCEHCGHVQIHTLHYTQEEELRLAALGEK